MLININSLSVSGHKFLLSHQGHTMNILFILLITWTMSSQISNGLMLRSQFSFKFTFFQMIILLCSYRKPYSSNHHL